MSEETTPSTVTRAARAGRGRDGGRSRRSLPVGAVTGRAEDIVYLRDARTELCVDALAGRTATTGSVP